jgi:hypothetical protein
VTKGVHVYEHPRHTVRGHRTGMPPKRLTFRSDATAGRGWKGLVSNYQKRGFRVVAVGCEEGAMAVHFL